MDKTSEQRGRELARQIADYVNGNSDHRAFIDELLLNTHRTLQQQAFGLFLKAIFAWSKTKYFDLRNQYTVETSQKIVQAVEFDSVPLI